MIALFVFAAILQSPPDAVVQDHKFQLEAMEMADQDARNQMIFAMNNNQTDRLMTIMHDVERIDREDIAAMKKIVAWGWPTISQYGKKHAHIAWLLVQHADQDVAFQKKCLNLMEPLVPLKEVNGQDFAYLFDRVARNSGKPQRYGTQLKFVGKRLVMQPTEDPKNLDKRRAAVGMMPMKDYIRMAEEMYSRKS
jgi:hypothetical protein